MKIELVLSTEDGSWTVYGPSGHYRKATNLQDIPAVVQKTVDDYAKLIIQKTALGKAPEVH